jgi:hypothetical protein
MKHKKETQDSSRQVTPADEVTDNKPVPRDDIPLTGESRRLFIKGAFATAPVIMTVTSRPAWGNACTPSGMVSGNQSTPGEEPCEKGLPPNGYIDPTPVCTTDMETCETTCEWALYPDCTPSIDVKSTFFDVFGVEPLTGINGNHSLRKVLLEISDPVDATTAELTTTELTTTESTTADATTADATTADATICDPATANTVTVVDATTILDTFTDWKYNDFDRTAVAAYFNALNGYTPYLTPYMVECMVRDVLNGGMYEVTAGVHWGQQEVYDYFWFTFDTTRSCSGGI